MQPTAAEFFVNPARRRTGPTSTDAPPSVAFHRRLPEYVPSRIVEASDLACELDLAALGVKDESQRLGLPSFKILGASWAVYQLLVRRLGREPAWDDVDELRRALQPLGA